MQTKSGIMRETAKVRMEVNGMKITLKAARINAGMTQEKAAKMLEVSPVTLYNWENGKTSPTAKRLERICVVYGVPKEQLKLGDADA